MPACRAPMSRLSAASLGLLGAVLGFATTLSLHSLHPRPPPRCPPLTPTLPGSRLEAQGLKGESGLLLVGIMTAQKYVDSRAWAVWKTWAPLVPGKIVFFVAEGTTTAHPELPLVRLPGTDDSYPPQKKSFMMLKWMAREGLGRFQWFLRADDDVYIRSDRLELLLRSLNASRPYLIGQAGLGTAEEYGTLSLGSEDNYCMGGPGVLFSTATLAAVAPHLPFCLRNMYTTHEDVEVGRCVRKFVGISCSWSYEMQNIFYNNQSGVSAYTGDLNVGEVYNAITLHPVKQAGVMARLHTHLRRLKTRDLRLSYLGRWRTRIPWYRSVQLSRDAVSAAEAQTKLGREPEAYPDLAELGKPPSLRRWAPSHPSDALPWDFLSPHIQFCAAGVNCPRHNAPSYLRYALGDLRRQLLDLLNRNQRQQGRVLSYTDTLYAYHRLDPIHGPEFILDLLLLYKKFKGRRLTVPVRRHAYVTQTFAHLALAADHNWRSLLAPADAAPAPTLTLVVPLSGRSAAFSRFLDNFHSACLQAPGDPTSLLVVLFLTQEEEDRLILSRLRTLRDEFGDRVRWLELEGEEFSRGLALSRGAAALAPDALMFFTDADVMFTPGALRRVRLNTLRGRRAYFPIVFSEFDPATWAPDSTGERLAEEMDERRGYFRHFGFGLVALYRSDLDAVGGIDTGIQGWGLEVSSKGGDGRAARVLPPLWIRPRRPLPLRPGRRRRHRHRDPGMGTRGEQQRWRWTSGEGTSATLDSASSPSTAPTWTPSKASTPGSRDGD